MRFRFITLTIISFVGIWLSDSAATPELAENPHPEKAGTFNFPLLRASGGHMRTIIENCFGYVKPQSGIAAPGAVGDAKTPTAQDKLAAIGILCR